MSSGRFCRSGNLRYPILGSYSDHQSMGQQSWSFLLCDRLVCHPLILHFHSSSILLPSPSIPPSYTPSSTFTLIFVIIDLHLYLHHHRHRKTQRAPLTISGLATLGTNISTNSIATSNDFAFIFPKYLNIKRGAFITSILGGWVTCPWQIQKSAQSLTTFLSGYVIVLAPILAIMVCLSILLLLRLPLLFSLCPFEPSLALICPLLLLHLLVYAHLPASA